MAFALLCGASPVATSEEREVVVLRGHAVCLDASQQPTAAGKDCPDEPAGGWAMRTREGGLHRLSPGDKRVAMLADPRVRSRELHIEAWRDSSGRLAIVHLYSIIDGKLHEPYYYCRTCAIKDYRPGLCSCCQTEYEFRERALPDAGSPTAPR